MKYDFDGEESGGGTLGFLGIGAEFVDWKNP
jgi:hypothetical protein